MAAKPRVLVFTGDGKGKTTAAMGMALRAIAHGKRVMIVQFVKNSPTGEMDALRQFELVAFIQAGLGFVPEPDTMPFAEHSSTAGVALRGVADSRERWDMVILDELCFAVQKGLVPEADVLELLAQLPGDKIAVLTGRNATPGLLAAADTVTEMKKVKHGYDVGIKAQKGVEE